MNEMEKLQTQISVAIEQVRSLEKDGRFKAKNLRDTIRFLWSAYKRQRATIKRPLSLNIKDIPF